MIPQKEIEGAVNRLIQSKLAEACQGLDLETATPEEFAAAEQRFNRLMEKYQASLRECIVTLNDRIVV